MVTWRLTSELEARREWLEDGVGYDAYCLSSTVGKEICLAEDLNARCKDLLVLPFLRAMHRSQNGVRYTEQEIILPGYVFLYAKRGYQLESLKTGLNSFRLVKNSARKDQCLIGSDRKYAEWVFNCGGVLGMSKAVKANGRVKIVSGPLFLMEGNIKTVSKNNRNCKIEVRFLDNIVSVWLPFEWVGSVENAEMTSPSL